MAHLEPHGPLNDFEWTQVRRMRTAAASPLGCCCSCCCIDDVTCYPRAGVSHVTPGRACHMLPAFLDAGAGAKVVQRCADQCSARTNRPYMCLMEHQPFSHPFKLEIVKYHSPSWNHLLDTRCAKKRSPGWTWQKTISSSRTSLAEVTGS